MSDVEETDGNLPSEQEVNEILSEIKPAQEQRQYHRYKVSFKVFIRLTEGGFVTAQAVDLSMGGVYIEYGASADVNKEYDLAFDLPFSGEFKRVLVKAKIVRSVVIASRNVYGLACIFGDFAKQSESVLEAYLAQRAK